MKQITNIQGKLLEGCIWDEDKQSLFFIDIEDRKIYQYYPAGEMLKYLTVPSLIGCIVLNVGGDLIAALQDGLYQICFEEKKVHKIMESQLPKELRYNDGKCDLKGNLWVGSMSIRQNSANAYKKGSLYCITMEKVSKRYDGYTIPNGLDWDLSQNIFYHIDSANKEVVAYRIKENNSLGIAYKVIDLSNEVGVPDGMCIDSEGNLWIAIWGGSKVVCCSPHTGKILKTINVPDKNVSCCVFGGENLETLYITTAKDEMEQGGEVYAIKTNKKGIGGYRYGK